MTNDDLGIKTEYLVRIIKLIQTRYSIVKKGVKYLENMENEYDLTSLSNIRDFLSHLETIFREGTTDFEIEANISQAEEHLRRALVESHQVALEARLEKFLIDYGDYEKSMLPNEAKYEMCGITNHQVIRDNILKINKYMNNGREKKGGNIWDNAWEEGIEHFIRGYELTRELHDELKKYKEYYYKNKFIHDKSNDQKKLAIRLFLWSSFVALVITFIFSDWFRTATSEAIQWWGSLF